MCHDGFTGADCSLSVCPDSDVHACSGHGRCDGQSQQCVCDEGYDGNACEVALCALGCSAHGFCQSPGHCVCAGGFSGANCEYVGCSGRVWIGGEWHVCNAHGACLISGQCACEPGWEGPGCLNDVVVPTIL